MSDVGWIVSVRALGVLIDAKGILSLVALENTRIILCISSLFPAFRWFWYL